MADLDLFNELNEFDFSDLQDMTQTQSGGGRGLLPVGTAFVRIVEYVELGIQKQREYQGQVKDPAPMVEIKFAIVGGSGQNQKGESEKYVLQEGNFPLISTYDIPVSLYDKSKYVKIHAALNRTGNKSTHPAQKLSEQNLYMLQIGTKVPTQGKNAGKVVQDIDFSNIQPAWDSISGCVPPMPEVKKENIKALIWDKPSIGQWDSIFVAGQFDAKTDEKTGKVTPAQSKNKQQEKILGALNFEESKLRQVLIANNRDAAAVIPSLEAPATPAATVQAPPADVAIPAGTVAAPPVDEAPAATATVQAPTGALE